jgi:hypothetical protein
MNMVRYECSEAADDFDIGRGLVNGLLVAIPLWIIFGFAVASVFQYGAVGETTRALLMIAAVCEVLLARPYARTLWARIWRFAEFHRSNLSNETGGRRINSIEDLLRHIEPKPALPRHALRVVVPNSLFRQSLALSALVGTYLQYYFIEVNLQIASLNSLTVFLPVTSMS